ncbi:MAG: hypothetical protein H6R20_437 [Proteobacteria bacterium]|jgi:hypothetical protein|nr:hypothetical protein [Pseudomonadota bacterium]
MPPQPRRRRKALPIWERGFRSHGYWVGKEKLGSVALDGDAPPEAKYRWQAGTHAGATATLPEAKRAVEAAVLLGTSQLPLFTAEH